MPNTSVVVKLIIVSQSRSEGVTLTDDKKWKSPDGGWLPVQAGTWSQGATAGVQLSGPGIPSLAFLEGMIFKMAKAGDSGSLVYEYGGDSGQWECIATIP